MNRPPKTPADPVREVESAMRALPRSVAKAPWNAANYIGAGESKLEFLDVRTPVRRERFKRGFSFSPPVRPEKLSPVELDRAWRAWDRVWEEAKSFEALCCATEFASGNSGDELVRRAPILVRWVERSDNWGTSDSLSSIYARIFESSPKTLASTFEKWSRSRNPWKRRQSLVSLLYYASARERHPPLETILRFAERAIEDDHYFVQKGLGWAIREAYNVYPERTLAWIRKYAARVHPDAWHATTEKLDSRTKARLKALRSSRPRKRGSRTRES